MNKTIKYLILSLLAVFIILIFLAYPYFKFVRNTLKISFLTTIFSMDSLTLHDNHVSVLFLGIAPNGSALDGPNLSDTIIIADYNFRTNKLSTISLPRDIWSPTLRDKLNSAYAYGLAKKGRAEDGLLLAEAETSYVAGLPIRYAAVIDFNQFEELINFLGGIDVNIDRSFVDKQFPVAGRENDRCGGDPDFGCRYKTIAFKQGPAHMDGVTALNFVRSRHAEGAEGSDFARVARQQKVIEAIKNKLIALLKRPNLETYKKLYRLSDKLVKRNFTNQQAAIIIKNIFFNGGTNLQKITLNQDLFINPPLSPYNFDGAWVLIPRDGNYDKIHQYIICRLNSLKNCH